MVILVKQDMEHPNTIQVVVVEQVVQHKLVVVPSVVLLVMGFNLQISMFLIICLIVTHGGLVYHLYQKRISVVVEEEEIIHLTYLKECPKLLPMVVVVLEDLPVVLDMELLA